MDEETTRNGTSSENGRQHEDVTALSTQELAHSEELVHGKQPEDVTKLNTKELEHSGELENGQEPEDVAALSTQGLAHVEGPANGREPVDVAALDTKGLEHVGEPPNGQQLEDVAALSTKELAQEGEPAKGQQPEDVAALDTQGLVHTGKKEREEGGKPEPQARGWGARKWIILAVVCILLLAGSAGAFLFLQHSQSPVSSGTISPTSDTTTGVTPVSTACPTSSTSSSCTTTTGLTPVAGTKSIFTLSFSGAVKGSMTVTSMTRCGPTTAGTEYDLYFIGTVGGIQYTYVSRIPAYKGPNTYGSGQVSIVFAQQPLSATTVWGNSGNAPAKMTINGDLKSGSMEVDLAGATNSVHVSGNWSCG
jgi:hypothetical protein